MTNSTDKAQKPKGPIRFEAIVPALILIGLITAYGYFFLDNHLRKGLEWTGGYVHGAEVNIANIKSSFFGGFLEIQGIQFTDKETPTQNLIAIGKVRFEVLWDALLRMKFVVNEAAIEQIEIKGKRKKAGWVRPPSPDPKEGNAIEKLEANALAQLEEDNNSNVLGDLAQIAGGVDEKDVLQNIQGKLQAEKKIDELKKALKEKEAEWKKRLDDLPDKKEFDGLSKQAKALKFNAKDPRQFASDLKTLNKLVKEADTKIKLFKTTGKGIKTDVGVFSDEISSVENLIKKDIEDIEKRLNIPKLDGGNFSKSLFMRMISGKVVEFQKYAAVAREYMPPPKAERNTEEKLVPRTRGEGENIQFKRTVGYPMFWVQKTIISSKASESGFSGNIEGALTDVTNNQRLIDKPTLLSFKGDFPNQGIDGITGLVTADHRTKTPINKLDVNVEQFPVTGLKLSDSSDVKLSLREATGSSRVIAELKDKAIEMKLWNNFTNTKYDMVAENKIVSEVLESVLNSVAVVSVNAEVKGSLSDFDLDIDSNLGKELSKGFSRYMKEKTDAIKKKIGDQIRGRVDTEKQKLNSEFSNLKGGLDKSLKGKEKEIEQAKNDVKNSSSSKTDESKQKIKDDLKKKGKDLLKKLKF